MKALILCLVYSILFVTNCHNFYVPKKKHTLAQNNISSEYTYYSKPLKINNNQMFQVTNYKGSNKIGYYYAIGNTIKFMSSNANSFFVLINVATCSVPGTIAHDIDSSFENNWKTKQTYCEMIVTPQTNRFTMNYLYAGPVSSFQPITITSSYSSNFTLGTITQEGLSLNNTYAQISGSASLSTGIQTQYSYNEPIMSAQALENSLTTSHIGFSWLYDFNWDYIPCKISTYTYQSLLLEVNTPIPFTPAQNNCGLNLQLTLRMQSHKDWFSGNPTNSSTFNIEI